MPTNENIIPNAPASNPLTSDPGLRPAIALTPNNIRAVISQGPKSSAHSARRGVAKTNITPAIAVPTKEDHKPIAKALPDWPFLDIGWPSKDVAIADGVPGIPNKQAVINPPELPPTCTPIIKAIPFTGSIPKLKGRVNATPIVIVKPGILPIIIPTVTPISNVINV